MALTFRSTGTTEIYIVEKDSDGAKRIARAVQDVNNPRQWMAQLEHPSGVRQCSPVYGNRGEVKLALTHYLHETEKEYQEEKGRGHRLATSLHDHNVQISENHPDYFKK